MTRIQLPHPYPLLLALRSEEERPAPGLDRPGAVASAAAVERIRPLLVSGYSYQETVLPQLPFEVAIEEQSALALDPVSQPDGIGMELSQEHLAGARVAQAVDLRVQWGKREELQQLRLALSLTHSPVLLSLVLARSDVLPDAPAI